MKKILIPLFVGILTVAASQSCSEVAEASTTTRMITKELLAEPIDQVSFKVNNWNDDKVIVKEVTISGHKYIVAAIASGASDGGSGIAIIPSLSETLNQ